jgi:hypothetical protein
VPGRAWILTLAVVAAVLALCGPASAGDGPAVAAEHHCSHASAAAQPEHPAGEPGDCCPEGCDACPSCTGGVFALLGARIEGPSNAGTGPTWAVAPSRGASSAAPGGIDHPPRA